MGGRGQGGFGRGGEEARVEGKGGGEEARGVRQEWNTCLEQRKGEGGKGSTGVKVEGWETHG